MSGMKSSMGQLMLNINADVLMERCNQNEKWGIQRHHMGRWLAILVEEVGEVAEAMQSGMVSQKNTDADNLYKELIQVAAVASAMAEQVKEEQLKKEWEQLGEDIQALKKPPYSDLDD